MSILSECDFTQILSSAITAPSGGNMQPWLIRQDTDAIVVRVNHARSHNLLDVQGAAAVFSLGMLIENILITAESLGYACTLETSTDHRYSTGNLVATVFFTGSNKPVAANGKLVRAVKRRCTNRRLHTGQPYTDDKIASLATHFKESECEVSFISNQADKLAIFEILASNDVFRLRHKASFEQLVSEIRWTDQQTTETRDGIDLKTLELPKAGVLILRLFRRRPSLVCRLPTFLLRQFSRLPILRSSHLGLVSMDKVYSERSMFQAGRDTQRLWLKATVEKIGFQPYTVITFNLLRVLLADGEGFTKQEQADIRTKATALCRVFGVSETAIPAFVFRLAKAEEPTRRSLRLPPDSFLA